MINTISIRDAELCDAGRILEIYAYYVKNTAITFEYDVPTLDEFRARMSNTMKKYPYLVIEQSGVICGYAYAGVFKARAAYDWACEMTVYIAHDWLKLGLGRKIYEALEAALQKMGILNLYACVAYPQSNDEYLTDNSYKFHEHLGFTKTGEFHKCGYKFGRWYDMVWMEKFIGEHNSDQKPVKCYPSIK